MNRDGGEVCQGAFLPSSCQGKIAGMHARRTILSIGYCLLGAGMGIAGASNMMEDLPDQVAAVAIGLGCIGAGMIVVGRYVVPEVNPPSPPSDPPAHSI